MSIIDTLKTIGCTSWYSLYGTIVDKIDNSTTTTTGSIVNYTLSNSSFAGYFNGASYVNGFGTLLSGQTFTMSIWFMQTVSATSGVVNTIFDSSNSAVSLYTRLYINSSNSLIFVCKNASTTITVTNPTTIVNNVWYNATVTHTTSAITMYVNGISVATGGAITLDLVNQTYNSIGAYAYANTNKFTGCLKNLMFFNTVLTVSQIKKLYRSTYVK